MAHLKINQLKDYSIHSKKNK